MRSAARRYTVANLGASRGGDTCFSSHARLSSSLARWFAIGAEVTCMGHEPAYTLYTHVCNRAYYTRRARCRISRKQHSVAFLPCTPCRVMMLIITGMERGAKLDAKLNGVERKLGRKKKSQQVYAGRNGK